MWHIEYGGSTPRFPAKPAAATIRVASDGFKLFHAWEVILYLVQHVRKQFARTGILKAPKIEFLAALLCELDSLDSRESSSANEPSGVEALLATLCIFMDDMLRYKFLHVIPTIITCMQKLGRMFEFRLHFEHTDSIQV